jgi:hypothetical protein
MTVGTEIAVGQHVGTTRACASCALGSIEPTTIRADRGLLLPTVDEAELDYAALL